MTITTRPELVFLVNSKYFNPHTGTFVVVTATEEADSMAALHVLPFFFEYRPTGHEENDGIPDTLKRKYRGARDIQTEADLMWFDEIEHSVDRAWRPCHQHGDGEDETGPEVCKLDGIQTL